MPIVEFCGERIECERGATLRTVLREAGLDVHNGGSTTRKHPGFWGQRADCDPE